MNLTYRHSNSSMALKSQTRKFRGQGAEIHSAMKKHRASRARTQRPFWSGGLGMTAKQRGNLDKVVVNINNQTTHISHHREAGRYMAEYQPPPLIPEEKQAEKVVLEQESNASYICLFIYLMSELITSRSVLKPDLHTRRSKQSKAKLPVRKKSCRSSSRQRRLCLVGAAPRSKAGVPSEGKVARRGLVVVEGQSKCH